MSISTKKIQLYPIGDKEEINRVFQYLRDGIYQQHHILNTYMSQVGCLYYKYNKDYKDAGFKDEYNAIFRNTNSAIYEFPQAKGLGMAGACGMRVKQDFSTALKNGLARGERNLPFYKRDFPLLVGSRFLTFYTDKEMITDEEGNENERDIYAIKFVNGIHFKVILGPSGKRDWYLTTMLDSIINDPENYKVCGSTIQLTKKGKIILNLTTKINKEIEKYEPDENKVMGLAMGYDKCLVAALSDDDIQYNIGDDIQSQLIEERLAIQQRGKELQVALRQAKGGHGRYRKVVRSQERQQSHEKNVVKNYNHILSKKVIDFAKAHKVKTIIIEDIAREDLSNYPVLLRNWSYYQLETFISYKAQAVGIDVILSSGNNTKGKKKDAKKNETSGNSKLGCCKCGCDIGKDNYLPKEFEWCNSLSFKCPECGEVIDYSYNKAKIMTIKG